VGSLERLAAGCLLASFPGPDAPRWILDLLDDGGLAGVVLFAGNVRSVSSLASLTERLHSVRPSALVAIDEEGGDVTRIEATTGSSFPGNAALGAVDDEALTFEVAAAIGALLASVGIDLDLAPCVDVNSDPRNPVIGVRSFGADPDVVARHGAASVRGLQSAGVAACAKHFPGHGHTSVDSHLALPVVDADRTVLEARELVPFAAAIEAGVAAIMTAHLVVPSLDAAVPATLSRAVLTGLLRERLGFGGAVVTDALDMAGVSADRGIPRAAVGALAAGADLCCLGPVPDEDAVAAVIRAVAAAVRSGDLAEARLHDAATRTAAIRRPSGTHPHAPEPVGSVAARRALRVLRTIPVPLVGAHVVELAATPGIAVGDVPWGLAGPMRALDPSVTSERVGPDARPAEPPGDRPLLVVARDGHRHRWQRDLIAQLTADRPDAVVVEMGWPHPDPATVPHLCTHGASRVSAEAAAQLLLGKASDDG
jgi:beta-N-acetylhexosaminidase